MKRVFLGKERIIVAVTVGLLLVSLSAYGEDKLVVKDSGGNNTVFNVTDTGNVSATTVSKIVSRAGSWTQGDVFSELDFYSLDTDHPALSPSGGVHAAIRAEHTRSGGPHTYADAGLTFWTLGHQEHCQNE